jgi:glycosyltransferase involved in cell wall biosynthesis
MKTVHIPRRFLAESWGGTETVVLETLKNLRKQGHPSEIFTSMALSDCAVDSLQGVPIRRFRHFYPYFGLSAEARHQLDQKGGNLFSWPLLWALLREPGLELLHLHTGKRMGGIVRMAAKLRKIPYVLSVHGGLTDVPTDEVASWTDPTKNAWEWGKLLGALVGSRRVVDDAAAILCLGKKEQEQLQKLHPRSRIELFPNGVDVDRFAAPAGRENRAGAFRERLNVRNNTKVLLCVARIDAQKNQLLALKVLEQLRAQGLSDYHLVLAGPVTNQAYFQDLERYAVEHQLIQHFSYCGSLTGQELVDAYHGSDLFLLCSRHEPFGIVLLEAWAAGLPVMASGVGGVVDLVKPGLGELFDPAEAPEVIAARIAELLGNPERCAQITGQALAEVTSQYGWDQLIRRLVSIYQEVARAHSVRQ